MNEKIAQLAYFKWEKAGRPHGKHEEFWLQAEKECQENWKLSTEVRNLWHVAKERHENKIQSIWNKVKSLISS